MHHLMSGFALPKTKQVTVSEDKEDSSPNQQQLTRKHMFIDFLQLCDVSTAFKFSLLGHRGPSIHQMSLSTPKWV